MENLELYRSVAEVSTNAKKPIAAGRLKGKTDINPMWRIEKLTEQFGPCGIGWKYVITDKRLEAGANGEISAFVDIDLYFKYNGEWSEAIPGTGGSAFVANERNGLYTSDECFKMALTDAISVACKALGFGANVYWEAGGSKYDTSDASPSPSFSKKETTTVNMKATPEQIEALSSVYKGEKLEQLKAVNDITDLSELSYTKATELCNKLAEMAAAKKNAS